MTGLKPAAPPATPPPPAVTAPTLRGRRRKISRRTRLVYGGVGTVLIIAAWEILPTAGVIDRRVIPPVGSLWPTMRSMFGEQHFDRDIRNTVVRALLGLLLGGATGTFIGVLSGLSKYASAVFGPVIALCYPVPVLIMLPLILNALGNGQFGWVVLIGIGPFFTMAISSRAAFADLSRVYVEVAKSFGASRRMTAARVLIPGALPALLSGARLALGAALLGTISTEYLVAPDGIGRVMYQAWNNLTLNAAMVALAVTAALALISYGVLSLVERLVLPWKRAG